MKYCFKKDIVFAYCHTNTVYHGFMKSITDLILYELDPDRDRLHSILNTQNIFVATARNNIVSTFLTTSANWLLFFDDDMVFAPDFLDKLLAVADPNTHKIVAGLYFGFLHDGNLWPTWLEEEPGSSRLITVKSLKTGEIKELGSVGMGGTLIHRSVFESMKEKYINDPWHWFAHDISTRNGKAEHLGEDVTFCDRARKMGIKIFGVTDARMDHLKLRAENLNTFLNQPNLLVERRQ
jgi:hypothetical protein